MGGVLVYQRKAQAAQSLPEVFQCMTLASEPEQAVRLLQRDHYQMVMIHLDQREESGFALASMIRGIPGYQLTPILFLAPDCRYEARAFHEFHCYDYLVTPIRYEEIVRILYPFLVQSYTEKQKSRMRVKIHGVTRVIRVYEIIYMESINRAIDIHTEREVLNIPYLQLNHCLRQYGDIFIQCHRSILVNRNYIQYIDYKEKKIELPGCSVDIGRQYEPSLHIEFDG